MSRSNHPKKPKKKPFYGCGRGCPICDPDCKTEWFRKQLKAQEKRDISERLAEVE